MESEFERIQGLEDIGEVLMFVRDFARDLGVKRQSYHFTPVMESPISARTVIYSEGFPDEWLALYNEKSFRLNDPIPERTMRHGEAISWADAMALAPNTSAQQECFASMREHGLIHGFGIPLFGSGGREAYASMDFDLPPAEVASSDRSAIIAVSQAAQMRVSRLLIRLNTRPSLSERELQVLGWIVRGKSVGEIGTILGLSPETVRTYSKRVYEKMGTHNRIGAIVRALKLNLVRF